MRYQGTVYRPPIEARSLLLPTTEGCTHNSCRFCSMYKGIDFRMLTLEEFRRYTRRGAMIFHDMDYECERIYLVGGDPFALSCNRLLERVKVIRHYAPECEVITMYASVDNIARKTDAELTALKEAGIDDLYIGVESGLEDVLKNLNKGNTVDEAREQLLRLNAAGISHLDMIMLGAAGKGNGERSALALAEFLNIVKPKMVLIGTMSLFPETAMYTDVQSGVFKTATEKEILQEERLLIQSLDLPEAYLWGEHPLDAVPIQGHLGLDKQAMLETLDQVIDNMDDERFTRLFRRESRSL